MKILILDDDHLRLNQFKRNLIGNNVTNVTTVHDTIKLLKEKLWDIVFLDHDLGGQIYVPSGPGTGFEVAEWLRDNPERKPKKIVIHSFCEYGRNNMNKVLPESIIFPGAWLKENIINNL